MANDDGHRSRPWRDRDAGKPGASDATPTDLSPGKQSLIDRDFGAPVRPGILVQRLGAPPSLVVQQFGITAPFVGPIQQRSAGAADNPAAPNEAAPAGDGGGRLDDSPVQARAGSDGPPGAAREAGAEAAAAQGIATPPSRLPPGFTILDLFGRRHDSPVQARTAPEGAPGAASEAGVHAAAAQGIATPSSRLPHGDTIQRLFGRHDISSVQAHTGAEATASARAMHADAYATGNHIVLGDRADLHTAAHEAAHVVQQRGGVQLKGGVGAAGDEYERHADAVADRVVAGQSAAPLLDQLAGGGHSGAAVQRAPAMPASTDSADPSPGDPAAFARLQGLLTHAGVSVAQQQLPTANLLAADAARMLNLLVQAQPSVEGIGPRMVAVRLMQDVVSGGGHTSIAAVVQRLTAFDPIVMLRPDGYIARAVTGVAIQHAGKPELVNGELHAGGLVAGTFYYASSGVFYRANDSQRPMGPPIGELGLEHDPVNSALDGAADALVGVATGLVQLIRHPIDSIAALRQLPGAVAQLIENSPEYWALFRAKPLNDQIRDVSKLVTTLATMYGGAAGATTRLAAGARDLGDLTIQVLKLSGRGELALATVSVPVGTVATALSGGPGTVYVLHMANSSLESKGHEPATGEKARTSESALDAFTQPERAVINEAKGVLDSKEFAKIRAAQADAKSVTVKIGSVTVQYEPGLPASGMTMFGEEGFLLGPEAFASRTELTKTVLHELYRLRTSASSGGVSADLAAQETKAAFGFAEKAAKEIQ